MNTAQQEEQRDNELVAKALESLKYAQQKESEARAELHRAIETTKVVKAKYECEWQRAETRAVARRKAGLIEVTTGY